MFNAIHLTRDGDRFAAEVRALDDAALAAATPDDDVTVAVEFSTINYKDGLAITNKSPSKAAARSGNRATRSFSTAGAPAKRTGADWRSARATKVSGWWRCRRRCPPGRPWRSGPRAIPRCWP
jgi:acrylyl-CoA reductase (NADPH)